MATLTSTFAVCAVHRSTSFAQSGPFQRLQAPSLEVQLEHKAKMVALYETDTLSPKKKLDTVKEILNELDSADSKTTDIERFALLSVCLDLLTDKTSEERDRYWCRSLYALACKFFLDASLPPEECCVERLVERLKLNSSVSDELRAFSYRIALACAERNEVEKASAVLKALNASLKNSKSANEALSVMKHVNARSIAFKNRLTAEAILLDKPNDPTAAIDLAYWYGLYQNDWKTSFEFLAKLEKKEVADVLRRENDFLSGPNRCLDVANAWYALFKKEAETSRLRPIFAERANQWYRCDVGQKCTTLEKEFAAGRITAVVNEQQLSIASLPWYANRKFKLKWRSGSEPTVDELASLTIEGTDVDVASLLIGDQGIIYSDRFRSQGLGFKLNDVPWSPQLQPFFPSLFLFAPSQYNFAAARLQTKSVASCPNMTYSSSVDRLELNFIHMPAGATNYLVIAKLPFQSVIPSSKTEEAVKWLEDWTVKCWGYDPNRDGMPPNLKQVTDRPMLKQVRLPKLDYVWWNEGDPLRELPEFPDDHGLIVARNRFECPAGRYRIETISDDGIRVKVDDRLLIEMWNGHEALQDAHEFTLTDGDHSIEVDYFEDVGMSQLSVYLKRIE